MGQIFDGAIKALRANPVVMFLFSAILMTISTVVELLLTSRLLESTMLALDQMDNPEAFGTDELSRAMSQGIPSALLGFALTFLIGVVLTGILTYAVSQAVLGFKPTLGQVWEAAKGRLLPLVGLTLLVGLLLGVPITVVVIAILAAAAVFPAAITVLLAFVAFFVVLAWAVVLIPVSTLATPALMLEGSSPITALRRGWALAKPYFWRILGIYLLTSLLAGVISSFITTPASIAIVALPTSAALVVQGIVTVIATTLVTPFVAAVGTLLYIDVRIRREGLAVELAAGAATGQ